MDYYSLACPASAPFFGYLGAASAMFLANLGAAYGTAKSGTGISGMGVGRPDLVMKALIPVVMAGVVGIYGLIIAVIISTKSKHMLHSERCRLCVMGACLTLEETLVLMVPAHVMGPDRSSSVC